MTFLSHAFLAALEDRGSATQPTGWLPLHLVAEAGGDSGLVRVEAGARGPHKLQRGYELVPTYSAHWIRDVGFPRRGRALPNPGATRDGVRDGPAPRPAAAPAMARLAL